MENCYERDQQIGSVFQKIHFHPDLRSSPLDLGTRMLTSMLTNWVHSPSTDIDNITGHQEAVKEAVFTLKTMNYT